MLNVFNNSLAKKRLLLLYFSGLLMSTFFSLGIFTAFDVFKTAIESLREKGEHESELSYLMPTVNLSKIILVALFLFVLIVLIIITVQYVERVNIFENVNEDYSYDER